MYTEKYYKAPLKKQTFSGRRKITLQCFKGCDNDDFTLRTVVEFITFLELEQ